jgi:hypothetical protein
MTDMKAKMLAKKWVLGAILCAVLSTPAIAAVADEVSPTPLASFSAEPNKPSAQPTAESESGSSDDNGIDEGSPIDTMLDTDKTRESLESRYENPADVALPPKLLVPKVGATKTQISKFLSTSKFNVYQLQHHHFDSSLGPKSFSNPISGKPHLQVMQSQTATLNSIPVNINDAIVSFKTPAQEFIDGASSGLLVLGSSALAMGGFIIFRTKRKDHPHA